MGKKTKSTSVTSQPSEFDSRKPGNHQKN